MKLKILFKTPDAIDYALEDIERDLPAPFAMYFAARYLDRNNEIMLQKLSKSQGGYNVYPRLSFADKNARRWSK